MKKLLKKFLTKNFIKYMKRENYPPCFTIHNVVPDSDYKFNHNNTKESFALEFFESLDFEYIITADDGFKSDFYFLRRLKNKNIISKKIFITKNFYSKINIPWWRILDFLFTEKKYKSKLYKNQKYLFKLNNYFYNSKYTRNFKELNFIFKKLLGEEIPIALYDKASSEMLTNEEITLIDSEPIDIGIHTVSHPKLSSLKYKQQFKEIKQSYDFNKKNFKNYQSDLAIPFGNFQSYNKYTISITEKLGLNCFTNHIKIPFLNDKVIKFRINIADYGDGFKNAMFFK